jgi:hypothetical protein
MYSARVSWTRAVCLAALACVSAFGQANQGSITGTVRDSSGAVVASAPIEIRNVETGAIFSAGASETGNFTVRVPAGTYELTVSVVGFRRFVQTNIPVIEGVATRRDVTLEVGQVSDTITVTDVAPLLKTEGGDVSYRVTTQLANQLPVLPLGGAAGLGNIRSPLAMTQILPGVQYNPPGFNGVIFQTLVVNGLPANSQTWTIDGQDATNTLWRGVGTDRSQAGVDALEAVTMQTSNFAAEFGKAGGAALNWTTKSGGNQFHGSVYNYYVNEFLHAGTPNTDWIDQSTAANNRQYDYKAGEHIRNRQRRNDYGFTIGGPVWIPKVYDGHDKTFFFFNFEQFRENLLIATGLATVPTALMRTGNFSQNGCNDFDPVNAVCRPGGRTPITIGGQPAVDPLGNPLVFRGIYDPNSYQIVNGLPVRLLYPGQQIPATSIDRVAKNIQDLFPQPTNGNLFDNYNIPSYVNHRYTTIPSIKINHNLSSTMRIDGYWGQTMQDNPGNNGFRPEQFPWTAAQRNPFRNHTVRINFDWTLKPTILLHVGVGYFHQKEPNQANPFNQSKIGLPGPGAINAYPAADVFPTMAGLGCGFGPCTAGGFSPGIGASFDAIAWEQKPTANLNLTWVKGNHTYKFGGDLTLQGYPTHNKWRANGNFAFGTTQSGNPWEDSGLNLNIPAPTGHAYASFLLGQPDSLSLAQQTFTRLGGHAFAFFAQDNWKVTPKLTLEYGLRYDFQTYLREQYGRHASAAFNILNPTTGLNGALAYEGSCHCRLSSNYPFAFGPRFNLAYQITSKTVLRAGFGVNYNVVQTPAGNNFSVGDFYSINRPGYGLTPLTNGLQGGNVFYKGNPFGNTEVIWPDFNPGRIPPRNAGLIPPSSPFSMYHPDSRPGRIMQWSVGIQREVMRDLVVEASYVGNRGNWFYAPLLDTMAINSLGGGQLERYGLDIRNANDRALLGQNIATRGVPNPAAAARGIFAPYAGFPDTQQVGQAIRPVPHWNLVNAYLGPNRGNTWYDSLQVQATKRYSHNLDMNVNFTWAHAMVLGASADTDFFFQGRPVVTDPFNRDINKQLNQLVPPLKTVIAGTYTTPGLRNADGGLMRVLSTVVKDWQIGVVLQYQSGQLLTTPTSTNQLASQLRITGPAAGFFSGIPNYNPWNFVEGASFYRTGFDPNGDFDPRAYNPANPGDPKVASVLAGGFNPDGTCPVNNCAWVNPAAGEWGVTSPFLEGFRWRRRPDERFNFGRNFRFGREGQFVLNVRAEFQNILNRMFYNAPSTANPTQPVTTFTQRGQVFPNGGYGVVTTLNGAGSFPRQGTLVARLTF